MSEPAVNLPPLRRSVLGGTNSRTPPARLGVAVVADLVAAIVTGELEPGNVLPPESTLCERFGVSRTVIRESVKRVEEKGLVVVAQGRGTTVNPPSLWNVLDPVVLSALVDHDDTLGVLDELTIVRASLEGSMSAEAARRLTPEAAEELTKAFEATEARIGDFEAYNDADAAFHYLIMEQSGIRLAANITRILFARARESARFTGHQGPEAMDITLEEHRLILDAILRGDAEGATQAMHVHIASAWARRRPEDEPTH